MIIVTDSKGLVSNKTVPAEVGKRYIDYFTNPTDYFNDFILCRFIHEIDQLKPGTNYKIRVTPVHNGKQFRSYSIEAQTRKFLVITH